MGQFPGSNRDLFKVDDIPCIANIFRFEMCYPCTKLALFSL